MGSLAVSRAQLKYLELIAELRLARLEHALRGEPFTQDVEVEYVAELDRWWQELSSDEQEAVEQLLEEKPRAPLELASRDVAVEIGGDAAPRSAAA